MIDARNYNTREELEAAMAAEHYRQIKDILNSKYASLQSDVSLLGVHVDKLSTYISTLDRHAIYMQADQIEEFAKHIIVSTGIIKSVSRWIPEKEVSNG